MAIEFFKQEEDSVSLDFLTDALEANPKLNGKLFDVFSFKKAKSGKGYSVYTSDFICWFFKKEKVLNQALEALDYYCKMGIGYQFVIQVDKSAKGKFHLGIDTERKVKYVPLENASYRLELQKELEGTVQTKKSEEKNDNPFLINSKKQNTNESTPVPLPPLTTGSQSNGDSNPLTHRQGRKGREAT